MQRSNSSRGICLTSLHHTSLFSAILVFSPDMRMRRAIGIYYLEKLEKESKCQDLSEYCREDLKSGASVCRTELKLLQCRFEAQLINLLCIIDISDKG